MAERRTLAKRRRVPDTPDDAERVSFHGFPFEDVLKGLLAVDPKDLDETEADDGDAS